MNGLMNKIGRKCAVLVAAAAFACGVPESAFAQSGETVEYIHTDALGSPVAVTNAAGEVIERTVYDPYGGVVNRPLRDGPGYTGHVTDASTGLSYMQQRYMDPELGVFLSVDPVTVRENGDIRHLNRYSYAYNNPYGYTDPDGRCGACDRHSDGYATLSGPEREGLRVAVVGVVRAAVTAFAEINSPGSGGGKAGRSQLASATRDLNACSSTSMTSAGVFQPSV